jgi:hypothetical protein
VLDGWSMPIVVRDVLIAYAAQREQSRVDRAAAGRYRDFIVWLQQRDAARGSVLARTLVGIKAPTRGRAAHGDHADVGSRRDACCARSCPRRSSTRCSVWAVRTGSR